MGSGEAVHSYGVQQTGYVTRIALQYVRGCIMGLRKGDDWEANKWMTTDGSALLYYA